MDRDPKTGQFLNGNSGGGRPKGQRNYSTIYREALRKIAETKNMTAEQIEEELHKVGLEKALDGDYNFYRDIQDRLNGKPKQPSELQVDGTLSTGVVILPAKEV